MRRRQIRCPISSPFLNQTTERTELCLRPTSRFLPALGCAHCPDLLCTVLRTRGVSLDESIDKILLEHPLAWTSAREFFNDSFRRLSKLRVTRGTDAKEAIGFIFGQKKGAIC